MSTAITCTNKPWNASFFQKSFTDGWRNLLSLRYSCIHICIICICTGFKRQKLVCSRDKPIRLARQTVWDNFFSANVRSAIRNLEHCVQAAYYDAPFLHRLERMLLKFTGGSSNATDSTRKRRRRWHSTQYISYLLHMYTDHNWYANMNTSNIMHVNTIHLLDEGPPSFRNTSKCNSTALMTPQNETKHWSKWKPAPATLHNK